jgi:hypothetical protein
VADIGVWEDAVARFPAGYLGLRARRTVG